MAGDNVCFCQSGRAKADLCIPLLYTRLHQSHGLIHQLDPYGGLGSLEMCEQQRQQCAGNEGGTHNAHPARAQAAEICGVFFHKQKFVKGLLGQRVHLSPIGGK